MPGDVPCAACKYLVEDIEFLVEGYDRSKSVKGCMAFGEFLKEKEGV